MQGLKTSQSVTDAKPDLGHVDKLPFSIAFLAKNWVRWWKWHLSTSCESAVKSYVCKDVCDPLGRSAGAPGWHSCFITHFVGVRWEVYFKSPFLKTCSLWTPSKNGDSFPG